MSEAPQKTAVWQAPNWHFPGVAVKGDDASALAAMLAKYADVVEAKIATVTPPDRERTPGEQLAYLRLSGEARQAREYAAIFRECWLRVAEFDGGA